MQLVLWLPVIEYRGSVEVQIKCMVGLNGDLLDYEMQDYMKLKNVEPVILYSSHINATKEFTAGQNVDVS
tara:strand:+ start:144 stop:353 length:210 start_codon:yes stop_codon:yes gene_type:complete